MKKIFCVFLSLVLFAGAIYANGNKEQKEEIVTLQMFMWDNVQKSAMDEGIAKFEETHPNIKVEISTVPWGQYWQKLQTTTVAGNAPDVFWMNVPNFPKYADNNLLLNLSEHFEESNVDISKYPSALIEKYSNNGNVYAIPEQFDTVALVYNKEMFDEANLSYPTEDWTWNDLLEASQKLTKETPEGKQYGFLSHFDSQDGYYNFMVMNGGEIISSDGKKSGFDNPKSIEAVQFLVDLIYKYEVSPDGKQLIELNKAKDLFTSGRAAMTTTGSWYVSVLNDTLGDKIDFAPLPKSPNTNERKSIIHGLSWAGYSKTKYPEETWALINYLISPEFNSILADTATTIPSYEGMASAWLDSIPYYNLKVFTDAVDYSWPYPVSKKTSEWMSVEMSEIKDAYLGNKSVNEAMNEVADKMNEILATEK